MKSRCTQELAFSGSNYTFQAEAEPVSRTWFPQKIFCRLSCCLIAFSNSSIVLGDFLVAGDVEESAKTGL